MLCETSMNMTEKHKRNGEMPLRLGTCVALAEVQSSVPSAHFRQLKNPAPTSPVHACTCAYIYT